jgi:mono/diheme cytochrome c family protein
MSSRIVCLVAMILLFCSLGMTAQTAPAASAPQATPPTIKHVPASYTTPSSGKGMYDAYCASCHGLDGSGDGLRLPPRTAGLFHQRTLQQ